MPLPSRLFGLLVLALSAVAPDAQPAASEFALASAPTTASARSDSATTDVPAATADRLAELEAQVAALEAERDAAVDVSGQVFTRYGMSTSGTGGGPSANSFALDRWYLTAKARVSESLRFRGTTDVVSTAPEARLGYTVILKYAYFDWTARPGVTLRAGVISTGWQGDVTKLWGYRGVAKTLAHQQKHVSSADVGAALLADLPAELGSVAVQVQNGSGFRQLETDRFKDVSARAMLTPFARSGGVLGGVRAGAHVYRGRYDDGRDRVRAGALLGYEGEAFAVAVNAERQRDGDRVGEGVSVFGRARLAAVDGVGAFSVIGLLDTYDAGTEDDRTLRSVVGLAYAPTPALELVLDYQRTSAETPVYERYDGTMTGVDAGLFLHAVLNY